MTDVYMSNGNTKTATIAADSSFSGVYDDTSGYSVVRLWCNSPNGALKVYINYADVSFATTPEIPELFTVFSGHASSISSIVKRRYAQVVVANGETNQDIENVKVVTKFVKRPAHPSISYMSDDVTANVTVALEDINAQINIDHSTHSIMNYGTTSTLAEGTHRALLTDTCGRLVISGSSDANPLIVAGVNNIPLRSDVDGNLYTTLTQGVLALDGTGVSRSFVGTNGAVNIRTLNTTDNITCNGPITQGGMFNNTYSPMLLGAVNASNRVRTLCVDNTDNLQVNVVNGVNAMAGDGRTVSLLDTNDKVNIRTLGSGDGINVLNASLVIVGATTDNASLPNSLRPVVVGGCDYSAPTPRIHGVKVDSNNYLCVAVNGTVNTRALNSGDVVTVQSINTPVLCAGYDGNTTQNLSVDSTGNLNVSVRALNGAGVAMSILDNNNAVNTRTLTQSDTVTVVGNATDGSYKPVPIGGNNGSSIKTLQVDSNGVLNTNAVVRALNGAGTAVSILDNNNALNTRALTQSDTITALGSVATGQPVPTQPFLVGGSNGGTLTNLSLLSDGTLKYVSGINSFVLLTDDGTPETLAGAGAISNIFVQNISNTNLFLSFYTSTEIIRVLVRAGADLNLHYGFPLVYTGTLHVKASTTFDMTGVGTGDVALYVNVVVH